MKKTAVLAIGLLCVLGQISACLAADPPKTGEKRDTLIYIRSTPPGAKVFVNGHELGKTDGLFPVEAGVATVILELEGHGRAREQVRIPANGITRIVIELKPQGSNAEAATAASPQQLKFQDRHFVRIVVGKESMTFEGKETTWQELPALLEKVPDRQQTVLEVAKASDDLSSEQRDMIRRAIPLSQRFGFEYVSDIGVHPLGSTGTATLRFAHLPKRRPDRAEAAAADCRQSQNNLKQLALAIRNFSDMQKVLPNEVSYGKFGMADHSYYATKHATPGQASPPSFPPASAVGGRMPQAPFAGARPPETPPDAGPRLPHSWRVDLLPYLGEQALYDQYRLDEPWDGPNNRKLLDKMPAVFRCPPQSPASSNTSYFMLVGPGAVYENEQGPPVNRIWDGFSRTILLVEAKRDVPWTKPEDIPYDPAKPLSRLGGWFRNGFNAAFVDGTVRFLPANISEKNLRALITRAGDENVDPADLEIPLDRATVSPREVQESALRTLVAKFVTATTTGEDFPLRNIGPQLHIQNTARDARRAAAAGANITDIDMIRIKGDKALVVMKFADITDHKYIRKNPHCVVYTWEKYDGNWVLTDIDLDDKERLAEKLRQLARLPPGGYGRSK
jgi:hypothetical protein